MGRDSGGVAILRDVSVQIPAGAITAIIGPSGAGKSSLLRLLNRLDDPTAGTIAYHGRPLTEIPVREHRRRVGFVFQTPVMFPGTVRSNLEIAASIAAVPAEEVDSLVTRSLDFAEIEADLLDRDGARLSVGQKQRVNLARTLMTAPETLLLDEPAAALDPNTADKLMRTVARLSADGGITVVTVTHRLAEAKAISGHVVMVDAGRVVEAGPAADLFERSSHPGLRSFLERVE